MVVWLVFVVGLVVCGGLELFCVGIVLVCFSVCGWVGCGY